MDCFQEVHRHIQEAHETVGHFALFLSGISKIDPLENPPSRRLFPLQKSKSHGD